jgi:phage terminase small subunit
MVTKNSFKRLSDRQKLFCKYVAEGDNQSTAAIKAGYSEKGNRSRASRLIDKDEIKAEIRRLEEEITTPRMASVRERKIRLSDIARAEITDYFEVVGGQLQWKANKEKPPNGIFSIKTITKTDRSGNTIQTVSVKLGNPIRAIDLLNRMDGLYRQVAKAQEADLQEKLRNTQIIVREAGKTQIIVREAGKPDIIH